MKKLLVTGGLGFIGSYFVDLALKRGYQVVNVDKKTYAARTDLDFDGRPHYEFIEEDIAAMPMGIHTVITDGANTVSGGQKQRLLVARAIAGKPRVLIFDEATSALDNRTQAMISRSLEGIQATRIVVAHRLSTIIGADRICVLEDGRLVEEGKYGELMAKNGLFAELVRRQTV